MSPSLRRAGELGKPAGFPARSSGAGAGGSAHCGIWFRGATLPADQRMPRGTDPPSDPGICPRDRSSVTVSQVTRVDAPQLSTRAVRC